MQISQACPSISLTVHGALGAREQAQDPKPQKQKTKTKVETDGTNRAQGGGCIQKQALTCAVGR